MTFMSTIANEAKDAAQTLTGIRFKKSFTPTQVPNKKVVGFNEEAFQYVDQKYRVVIENSNWRVNAWLQDEFEFNVDSTWEPLSSVAGFDKYNKATGGLIDTAAKAITGTSLKNMAMTRRKWTGSSPLNVQLKLKFRTYDDADIEVVQAIHALQAMCLPGEMEAGDTGVIIPGFLIPPGPNEMYVAKGLENAMGKLFGNSAQAKNVVGRTGDVISIDLFGGGFYLDMVVINRVFVKFDSKMTAKGPVAAEVVVNLQSYEVLTKQKLDKVYSGAGYISTKTPNVDLGKISVVKNMGGK